MAAMGAERRDGVVVVGCKACMLLAVGKESGAKGDGVVWLLGLKLERTRGLETFLWLLRQSSLTLFTYTSIEIVLDDNGGIIALRRGGRTKFTCVRLFHVIVVDHAVKKDEKSKISLTVSMR